MFRVFPETKRLSEIVITFAKNGFATWVEQTRLYGYISSTSRHLLKRKKPDKPTPERFRKALEELGPTFVKMGQILSTRGDVLPETWMREFSKLQDKVPPSDFGQIEKFLESELGKPVTEAFASFDREPFAAASIGQVYNAVLHDGAEVVVKVQRPGVNELIRKDLEIIEYLAEQVEKHISAASEMNIRDVVREFARYLKREIDYNFEANFIKRFRENFAGNDAIYIPKVFDEYTTKRVLVIEKIKGKRVEDVDLSPAERRRIAREGARAVLQQVFKDGLFHADPHPGNLFIMDGGVIGVIDFGMVGRSNREMKRHLSSLMIAMASKDEENSARIMLRIGSNSGDVNVTEFKKDIAEVIDQFYGRDLQNIEFGKVFNEMLKVIRRYKIHIPVEYTMVIKALLTIERFAATLDPAFNIAEESKPFIRRLMLTKFSPVEGLNRTTRMISEFGEFIQDAPGQAQELLRKLQEGEMAIRFKHENIDKLVNEITRASTRLSYSMIILALAVAGSVLITFGKTDFLKWSGVISYMLAGGIGSLILLSTIFKGRL